MPKASRDKDLGRTRMGMKSRRKGQSGEREIVQLLKKYGWGWAKRTQDGYAQLTRGDIENGPGDLHIEVKRTETTHPWAWIEQAERDRAYDDEGICIAFRRNSSAWYAIVDFEKLLGVLQERDGFEARC